MGLRTWTCKKILPYVLQRVYHDGMLDSVNAFVKAQKEGLMVHEMIYHPKKTHSTFYLPLALSDEIQQFVFMNDDYYEVEQLDHIFHRFHEGEIAKKIQGKTVLDIGANIGNHTLYFMNEIMLGNGKCICFEVMPETVKILQKNIELNHLEDRVTVNSFGLSDRDMHASPSHGYNLRNIGANPIQEDAAGTLEVRALVY